MEQYLKEFTERALIGTRSGEPERLKIEGEIESLLKDKPKDASPEMVYYLEFLLAVTRGEDAEELWGKLTPDLQSIFGEVMKKFKGAEITEKLKEITRKTILARQKGTDRDAVIAELQMILDADPEKGRSGVARYIRYLHAMVEGKETEEMAADIEQGLVDIFNETMQDISGMDMMTFFDRLTESAFHEARTGEHRNNISVRQVINEIQEGDNPPPQAIVNYLTLILALLDGEDTEEKLLDVAPEFQALFNKHKAPPA